MCISETIWALEQMPPLQERAERSGAQEEDSGDTAKTRQDQQALARPNGTEEALQRVAGVLEEVQACLEAVLSVATGRMETALRTCVKASAQTQ